MTPKPLKGSGDAATVTTGLLTLDTVRRHSREPQLQRWHIWSSIASDGVLHDELQNQTWEATFTSPMQTTPVFVSLEALLVEGWTASTSSSHTTATGQTSGSEESKDERLNVFGWLDFCPALTSLTLVRCNTPSVVSLEKEVPRFLSRLTTLSISHDGTLHDLSFLRHCTSLTSLSLKYMKNNLQTFQLQQALTGERIASSQRFLLQQLTHLDLSNTSISNIDWMRVTDHPPPAQTSSDENTTQRSHTASWCVFPHLEVLRVVGCERLFSLNAILTDGDDEAAAKQQIASKHTDPTPSGTPQRRSGTLVPKLRVLDISWSGVNDLRFVYPCANTLEELYMDGCKTIGDHHSIGALTHLKILHAQHTTFSHLHWIPQCKALVDLDLGRCFLIEDLAPLGALPHLQKLVCPTGTGEVKWNWLIPMEASTKAEGKEAKEEANPFASCACAAALRELHVDGSSGLRDGHFLSALTQLHTVVLSSVNVTGIGFLTSCPLVEVVSLNNCRSLTTEALEPLSRLRHLRHLQLCDSVVKEVRRFLHPGAACLKSLEEVELTLCSSLHDLSGIGLVKGLKRIMISEASLGDISEELKLCTQLEEVDVSYVDTLEDFQFVRSLARLQSLSVSRTSMASLEWFHASTKGREGDPEPPHLRQGLEDLNLSYCFMLTQLPSFSAVADTLRTLHLSQCGMEQLTGLERCHQLSELYIGQCGELRRILPDHAVPHPNTASSLFSLVEEGTAGSPDAGMYFSSLTRVTVHHCDKLESLNWLQHLCRWQGEASGTVLRPPKLRELKVAHCKHILPGEWLHGLRAAVALNPSLTQLELMDSCVDMTTLSTWISASSAFPAEDTAKNKTLLRALVGITTQLTEVNLSGLPALASLHGVEKISYLSSLRIANCATLSSLRPVGRCPHLLQLDISRCKQLASMEGVWDVEAGKPWYPPLQLLRVSELPLLSFGASLSHCVDLYALHLSSCAKLREIMESNEKGHSPQLLPQLRELKILDAGIHHVEWLSSCPQLEDLEVSFCPLLFSLQGVERLTRLRRLAVTQCGIRNLDPLHNAAFVADFLEEADFSLCSSLQDMMGLAPESRVLSKLKRLSGYGTGVVDISWVARCPALEKMDFRECRQLKEFGNLSAEKLMRLIH